MPSDYHIRTVTPQDLPVLQGLIAFEFFVHRHLDWNSPLDWIGHDPFLVLEHNQRIVAALACPEDPPGVTWVHFFLSITECKPGQTWPILFSAVLDQLKQSPQIEWVSAISTQTWFTTILQDHGFQHFQDIVVLERDLTIPGSIELSTSIQSTIRPMESEDLALVEEVDYCSFHPLWRNTIEVLTEAWRQGAYSTVAVVSDRIVGYQICTSSVFNAHLARLAVLPQVQRHGIGSALIDDLSNHFYNQNIMHISVNTQSDNTSSLALYQKVGFTLTGDSYPVFVYPQIAFRS
jgi:ribosomal protein S18 acetylase RimI-like enzyme